MSDSRVLILGGCGRIGRNVAADVARFTEAEITLTYHHHPPKNSPYPAIPLDVEDDEQLRQILGQYQLVVHCAGPFHHRTGAVLKHCIEQGVHYVDVSDSYDFVQKLLPYHPEAQQAGVTAIVSTGIFPGMSNSLVRYGVEQLDRAETIRLYYGVGGSGGAGLTVMRTTFLGLKEPFQAWLGGKWQEVHPYSDRQNVTFPQPCGSIGVYWYDMPETHSLVKSFPTVQNVITKFGSYPDFYNHLTWITAHVFPKSWLINGTEFLAQVSYNMTQFTDQFSGVGVAIQVEVEGWKDNQACVVRSQLSHPNTAQIAGHGTGGIVQGILAGTLQKPGVWSVEEAVPTHWFLQTLAEREITLS
ncbi:saccharopine dehydrogenase NADP-binding domain-containing protein [Spirulina subsalsa FACHB-351]|uniref:Saccharopine dehydrogenase NADP-binding domain-containing protein n=1 Tax=Spirulina subsalsa FACHB-351 TaxID=234711 RepID=A0ABT3LBB5_9CYAN|nr:saccharopine dehydrogenase NADP-binding domain-containing protein [Spirulina subsalsa]MCW6038260.1 saccharopine dehydrogenase NADP-binding domain-containing protein [Spirulina subsalsa FACHB-351]